MKKEAVEKALSNVRNGSYVCLHMSRMAETYKKLGELNITKDTQCVVRLGVRYGKIQDGQLQARLAEKAAAGENINKLPWGEWVEGSRYLIKHKEQLYLRCTVSRSPKHHSKVQYYQNGKLVSRDDIEYALTASEKKTNDELIFTIPLDSILSLGKAN